MKLSRALIFSAILLLPVFTFAQKLVWPQPPEKARIEFIKSVTKAEDLEIKKGFFKKFLEFFAGSEEKVLVKPFGIHVDGDKIFVTDVAEAALFIFDTASNDFKVIEGFKKEKFIYPVDVATDDLGFIYVSDSMRKSVYIFNENGVALKKISEENGLKRPTGIAVDKKRQIFYVCDTLSSKILKYSLNGKMVATIGAPGSGNGELNRPTFITLDEDGSLYVTDSMNFRVNIYDKNGKFKNSFGQLGNSIGNFASPRGIAVDKYGHIYVTDTLFNAVQIFDKKGNLLLVFGSEGKGNGEFYTPMDISISDDGRIFITDSYNMRVEIFKILGYKR